MLIPQLLPAQPRPAAPPRKPSPAAPAAHGAAEAHHSAAHQPTAGAAAASDADQAASLELALMRREQTFDLVAKRQAEDEREANVLRDMAMAQLKKDDENLKKWVALI